ncbi:MAG: endolytic transglycosylase MltG [Neisseriaceae bacterium]|nr:endolytic transglycosylase MltG [Neisseriaceae bacterium]
MKKILFRTFYLIVFILFITIGFCSFLLFYPKQLPDNYQLLVKNSQGWNEVANTLQSDKAINHKLSVKAAVRIYAYFNPNPTIQAGFYRLSGKYSAWQIVQHLSQATPDKNRIRIAEGRTFAQIRNSFPADLKRNTSNLSEKEILSQIDPTSNATNLEGLLFPDTYIESSNLDEIEIYRIAYKKMQKTLNKVWENRDTGLPYQNPYELLIMASIIEKETSLPEDRNKVSAVFVNRLKINMRLQTDPTVIYGMGDKYQGKIHKEDLQRDTPYNTYTRHGLPPTPICAPSQASLEAAAHPADVTYIYFVAKQDGSKESYFSNTLQEHNEAVQRYILKK